MKEDKYANILAKIQVSAVFRRWDILRNVLPRFIELCMETNRNIMSLSLLWERTVITQDLIFIENSTYYNARNA